MIQVSRTTHSLFIRLAPGDSLLDALHAALSEGGVATGTLQGHGGIEDVELRTFSPETRGLGVARRLAGAVHALAAFGSVGLSEGTPQVTLRAVLSRETDTAPETLSGVVTQARVVAFEALVVSAQDLALPVHYDPRGVPMIELSAATGASPIPAPVQRREEPSPWADAIATSRDQPPLKPVNAGQGPLPPVRPPSPRRPRSRSRSFRRPATRCSTSRSASAR